MTSHLETGSEKIVSESNYVHNLYRPISSEQITQLNEQGCSCEDWSKVEVAEGFRSETVRSTHFCGQIKLGVFDKDVK